MCHIYWPNSPREISISLQTHWLQNLHAGDPTFLGWYLSVRWSPGVTCRWEWSAGRGGPRAPAVALQLASYGGHTPWGNGRMPTHSTLDWRTRTQPKGFHERQSLRGCRRTHQTRAPSWRYASPGGLSVFNRRWMWVGCKTSLTIWCDQNTLTLPEVCPQKKKRPVWRIIATPGTSTVNCKVHETRK